MFKRIGIIISSLLFSVALTAGIASCNKDSGKKPEQPTEIIYTLSDSELSIVCGEKYQLTMSPIPQGKVTWTSSNEAVATVKNGEVFGVSVGTADIKGTMEGKEYVCKVTVGEMRVNGATITLPRYQANLPVGSAETFEAQLVVNNTVLTETVTWTVQGSDEDVISEDDYTVNGNEITVEYKNVGIVVFTATYGETEANYVVYVMPLEKEELSVPEGLSVQGEILSWTAVENAVAYGIRINDLAEVIVEETSFTNAKLLRENGSYQICVRAIADPTGYYLDGEYSKKVQVNCTYLSFYKFTGADNQDYVAFTALNGEVDSYYLYKNGVELKQVQPIVPIAIGEYGESSLQIMAKMSDGTAEYSRKITFLDDTKITWKSQYGGGGVSPVMDSETVPVGGNGSALKLNVHTSSDSSYQIALKDPAFANLKKGATVSYRIRVTDISTNLYANRNDWENGKQTATSVPFNRIVGYRGVSGYVASIPGANGAVQADTWYTVYATLNTDVADGTIEFSTFLATWQSKTEQHYHYTLWIDSISIGGVGDAEFYTSSGSQSLDNRPFSSTIDTENTFNSTAAIKIVTGAGSYGDSSGYVSNVAFANVQAGDYISYYIKVGESKRSSTKDGEYSDTTLKVSELVNPAGFGAKPVLMRTVGGAVYTGEEVDTGVWYKVVYQLSGKENDTENTAFKRIKFNSGRIAWMRSGSQSNFINATFYVDGIRIGSYEDMEFDKLDANLFTTWHSQYGGGGVAPQIVSGADLPVGCQSDAALKLNVSPSADSSYQIALTNPQFATEIMAGSTLTYRIYVTNITTNLYDNRNDWENGKQSVMSVPLNRLVDYGAPSSHTSTIVGNPGAIAKNTWYTVKTVITSSVSDGSLEFGTFLAEWQSKTERHYAYTLYIDLISINAPEKADNESFIAEGGIGIDGLSMKVEKSTDTYGAGSIESIKVTTESGIYKTCSGTMTNPVLFGALKAGDTISYYIKAVSVGTSSTSAVVDRQYTSQTTVLVKQLLNPASWDKQLPVSVTKADGTPIANGTITGDEVLTVGEWYKVSYTATGKENDSDNTTFKRIAFNSGKACWMQYGWDTFMKAEWIIDGITIDNN